VIIELGKKLYNFGVKLRVKTSCSIVVTVKNSDDEKKLVKALKSGATAFLSAGAVQNPNYDAWKDLRPNDDMLPHVVDDDDDERVHAM